MSAAAVARTPDLPAARGRLTADAPLAPLVWFKAGGAAQWLFEPADVADLAAFLRDLDPAVAVSVVHNRKAKDGDPEYESLLEGMVVSNSPFELAGIFAGA